MSVVRKTYTNPDGIKWGVECATAATHAVLSRSLGAWFVWSTHTTETAARKSATAGRLKSGNRVIVELEDVS